MHAATHRLDDRLCLREGAHAQHHAAFAWAEVGASKLAEHARAHKRTQARTHAPVVMSNALMELLPSDVARNTGPRTGTSLAIRTPAGSVGAGPSPLAAVAPGAVGSKEGDSSG
jgi:hypothetical protein